MHEQSRYSHVCVTRACLLFTSSLRNIVFLLFTIANAANYVSSCPKISRNLSLVAVLSFVCFSDPQPPTISQIFGSPLKTTCCFGRIEFTFLHKRHNTELASNIVFYTNFTSTKDCATLAHLQVFLVNNSDLPNWAKDLPPKSHLQWWGLPTSSDYQKLNSSWRQWW